MLAGLEVQLGRLAGGKEANDRYSQLGSEVNPLVAFLQRLLANCRIARSQTSGSCEHRDRQVSARKEVLQALAVRTYRLQRDDLAVQQPQIHTAA